MKKIPPVEKNFPEICLNLEILFFSGLQYHYERCIFINGVIYSQKKSKRKQDDHGQ